MDQFEQAVLDYICARPERFANWQFTIAFDGFQGGSCPDFVVLDLAESRVYVVEVTCGADSKRVSRRVQHRHSRWIEPLRKHFASLGSPCASWDYHITVVVREEELQRARTWAVQFPDVSVLSLDKVMFSWRWPGRTGSHAIRCAKWPKRTPEQWTGRDEPPGVHGVRGSFSVSARAQPASRHRSL